MRLALTVSLVKQINSNPPDALISCQREPERMPELDEAITGQHLTELAGVSVKLHQLRRPESLKHHGASDCCH